MQKFPAFPYAMVFLIPISVFLGLILGNGFTFLTPIFVFGVVPLLDLLIGIKKDNPSSELESKMKNALRYRLIPIIAAIMQILLTALYLALLNLYSFTPLEYIGFTISMGICSGVMGINIAHELVHRVNSKWESSLGFVSLLTALYVHWGLEHITGHHRYVATPNDPATARKGENVFFFIPRSVFGGLISAIRFEHSRLKRRQKKAVWLRNRVIYFIILQFIFVVSLFIFFHWIVGVIFVAQSIVAIGLLEIVNYLEHYGLLRKYDKSKGKYEPVKPEHSWNSSNLLTNWFLINLQRHSDHHYAPWKRYQVLNHHEESLQLPTGYAGMVIIALIPPLWFHIMDKKIL